MAWYVRRSKSLHTAKSVHKNLIITVGAVLAEGRFRFRFRRPLRLMYSASTQETPPPTPSKITNAGLLKSAHYLLPPS
jgi:RecB family exonuclease